MRELGLIAIVGVFLFMAGCGDEIKEGDTTIVNESNTTITVTRDLNGYNRTLEFKAVEINGTMFDMQYTGLDDQNGTKIYEQDKIDFFGTPANVVFTEAGFKAEIDGYHYEISDIQNLRLLNDTNSN